MKKSIFLLSILERRIKSVFFLALMFTSLMVILMVGVGVKGEFYQLMRSDYGNIPDMKAQFNNISFDEIKKINNDIANENISTLFGYEGIFNVSIINSEDSLLASNIPLFFKGVHFDTTMAISTDDKILHLPVVNISYDETLQIDLDLQNNTISDANNVLLMVHKKPIKYPFCYKNSIENSILHIRSTRCKNKADQLLSTIDNKNKKTVYATLSSSEYKLKIIDYDLIDTFLVLDIKEITKDFNLLSVSLDGFIVNKELIESTEIYKNELTINFKKEKNTEKIYKRFLSQLLENYINYKRMILKLDLYAFEDDDEEDKQDNELVYLNELTDYIDIIFKKSNDNILIASEFLANDLSNFGLLEDFLIRYNGSEFKGSIRSTLFYNPEKIYNKNLLIVNNKLLQKEFKIAKEYNYMDIYLKQYSNNNILKLKQQILSLNKEVTFIMQEDIIPSITPKKSLFMGTYYGIFIFIFIILLVALYIVLIQFYSNYADELALFKLFGSAYPYQTLINFLAFILASIMNFYLMIQQEAVINSIMLKFFFIDYIIEIKDFWNAIGIIFIFIVIIYGLEKREMNKLNIIKGQ
jgi:hypothetical protein